MESPTGGIHWFNVEYLFSRIVNLIASIFDWLTSGSGNFTFGWFFILLKILAAILVLVFIGVIVYSIMGILKLREEEHHEVHHTIEAMQEEPEVSKNSRWQVVEKHIESENPSDWKLAIIEADLVLEKMLDEAGYQGETIGEKLRNAEDVGFKTLGYAREAHAVRNQIAHQGSEFAISKTKAHRTIAQYKDVFVEFDYI